MLTRPLHPTLAGAVKHEQVSPDQIHHYYGDKCCRDVFPDRPRFPALPRHRAPTLTTLEAIDQMCFHRSADWPNVFSRRCHVTSIASRIPGSRA